MSLTVGELIDLLEGFNPKLPVIMTSDNEGSGETQTIAQLTKEHYVSETPYTGFIVERANVEDETEAIPVVILWPH